MNLLKFFNRESKNDIVHNYQLVESVHPDKIWKACDQLQNYVCIKVIEKIPTIISVQYNRFKNEISIMNALQSNRHVVELVDVFQSEGYYFIVTPFYSMDLLHYVNMVKPIGRDESHLAFLFRQMVKAVAKMHRLGYAHRDIKLENFVLNEELNIKLIDFGHAVDLRVDKIISGRCGSTLYCCPAILSGNEYSPIQADIWSLGICLYVMAIGRFPWEGATEKITIELIKSKRLILTPELSPNLNELIGGMLKKVRKNRFTMRQIINHEWLKTTPPKAVFTEANSTNNTIRNIDSELPQDVEQLA
jgi:serine/threonine protein kinase